MGVSLTPLDDRVELVLREILETGSLGQIAADPAVPVLVAAALVQAVRIGEIGEHAQGLAHQHVQGRLCAVDWLQCIRQSDEGRMT